MTDSTVMTSSLTSSTIVRLVRSFSVENFGTWWMMMIVTSSVASSRASAREKHRDDSLRIAHGIVTMTGNARWHCGWTRFTWRSVHDGQTRSPRNAANTLSLRSMFEHSPEARGDGAYLGIDRAPLCY